VDTIDQAIKPPSPGNSVWDSTIGLEIRRRAEQRPNHAAVASSSFGPLSYRQLQGVIDQARVDLRRIGFGRNARIAIAIPNGPPAALAVVAVACSAASIPCDPRQPAREIAQRFDAIRPDAVLLMNESDSAARQVAEQKGLTIIEAAPSGGSALDFCIIKPQGRARAAPNAPDEPDPNAPAFILQTSGTAAEPKLIPYSHSNMLAAAARVQDWFNLTPQDRCLSVSPLFYSHGLKVTLFTPLLSGGTVVFPTDAFKFDYSEWFEILRPTWYSAGPTLHRLILDQTQIRADAANKHSLRFVLSGGAPLPQSVQEGLQRAFCVPVVEHYGSSEAAQISANLPYPGRSKPGTCGIPPAGTILVVGDDGGRLPSGERGEILVGGPTVISGYLNAPELNRDSFVNGWFRSGDIGSLDEDGFLTLHNRKSDLINRGGEKISPVEVDEALMRHPAVAEAAAFGVPHPRLGQDIAAAVVLRAGARTSPIELRKFLHDQVAPFKVPRRIVIRDQLPKGTTGKVLRRRLTDSWEENAPVVTNVAALGTEKKSVDTELSNKLKEIWGRLLKVELHSPDDDFFEMGGDSLLATEMLVELELLTGKTIPSSILFEATTIRQLARKLSEQGDLELKNLVPIHAGGSQWPLIYFHGNYFRFGASAIKLAQLLGSEQPLFVIAPHGIEEEAIPPSIEAMAADRLQLILNAQPKGPYRLGGKCIGGIVAFEVARMLIAAGKEVEMVVMLDSPTINALRSMQLLFSTIRRAKPVAGPAIERVMAWSWFRCAQIQRFLTYPWNKRRAAIRRRWTMIKARLQNSADGANHQVPAIPTIAERSGEPGIYGSNFTDIRTAQYSAAMSNYAPVPLAVRVIFVKVEFDGRPWRRISPDMEIVESPGTHEDPDYASVAEHLRVRLEPSKQ
jgi:acyl-CoA synthetase (AMP-forming)/AMP-acid ligase II/thioesterase domain-containing protein